MRITDDFFKQYLDAVKQFRKINMNSLFQGVSHGELSALMCIKHGNEDGKRIKVSNLSKDSRVNFASMSRTLRRLEEKEYIVRSISTADRRITYVELTDKGKAFLDDAEVVINNLTTKITATMGEEDMKMLSSLLKKLADVSSALVEDTKKEYKERNQIND